MGFEVEKRHVDWALAPVLTSQGKDDKGKGKGKGKDPAQVDVWTTDDHHSDRTPNLSRKKPSH